MGAAGSTYRNEGDAHVVMKAPAGPSSTEAPPPTANPAPPLWSLYFLRRELQVALSSVVESEGVSMKADIARSRVIGESTSSMPSGPPRALTGQRKEAVVRVG